MSNDNFCKQLGQVILSAGKLESELIKYISKNSLEKNIEKKTLGQLINIAKDNNLLYNLLPALENIKNQRNYITHNIHALLSNQIEETILLRSELLDSDVLIYVEIAWVLTENINNLANIVAKYNERH